MIIAIALLALLFPAARAGSLLISFFALLFWIQAYALFRKALAKEATSLPRYDDPQEGIWPPPPTNPP